MNTSSNTSPRSVASAARPVRLLVALIASIALALGLSAPFTAQAADEQAVTVTVSEVNLDGPLIAPVTVTVKNASPQKLRNLKVNFSGPTGWLVYPESRTVKGSLNPGTSTSLSFDIQVPSKRAGFHTYEFTAVATYSGGDQVGTATGTRTQRTGTPLANLAAAYNNVGVTDETNTKPGNWDAEGNSFSAQKLAAVGITPGAKVNAIGATFTWPTAVAGTKGNVASGGQAITVNGQGSRLAFLGSGSSTAASGLVTVHYTDGTSSAKTLGFPNWSFQNATEHGATLVASSMGRNRPSGYGDAAYAYRVFANSITIDPAKTVEFVVLPSNGALHLFDMVLVP